MLDVMALRNCAVHTISGRFYLTIPNGYSFAVGLIEHLSPVQCAFRTFQRYNIHIE